MTDFKGLKSGKEDSIIDVPSMHRKILIWKLKTGLVVVRYFHVVFERQIDFLGDVPPVVEVLEGRVLRDGSADPVLPQPFLHQPQVLDEVVVDRRVHEDVFAALQHLRVQGELAAQQETPLI